MADLIEIATSPAPCGRCKEGLHVGFPAFGQKNGPKDIRWLHVMCAAEDDPLRALAELDKPAHARLKHVKGFITVAKQAI